MYKGQIRTVNKYIPPDQLGYCQCHEHVYIKGIIDDIDKSLSELVMYKNSGGNSIVDAQPLGAGSDIEVLKHLSNKSNVHIVGSTGFHKDEYYKPNSYIYEDNSIDIAKRYIKEIENGAGIIKAIVQGEITGNNKKLHEACAITSYETGAPVMCHIDKESEPLDVVDFYMKRKIAPERLILCHADRFVLDISKHIEALKMGVFLEYDTIARTKYHDNDKEADIIKTVLNSGYVNQILISLDTTKERLKSYGSDIGLTYILDSFIPLLKGIGVTDEQINIITIQNPSRALRFV